MVKSLNKSMKKLKVTENSSLKDEAKKNVTASKGNRTEGYTTLVQGVPLEHNTKQKLAKKQQSTSARVVGMSLGSTLNMDNYESLRIDCWLSDSVRDDESESDAFQRIRDILEQVLEETSLLYKE